MSPTVCANGAAMLVRRDAAARARRLRRDLLPRVGGPRPLLARLAARARRASTCRTARVRHRVGAVTSAARPARARLASSHHNLVRFALKCLPAGAAARVVAGELLRLPAHPRLIAPALARASLRELPEILRLRRAIRPTQAAPRLGARGDAGMSGRALVVSNDHVGSRDGRPGIRAYRFARRARARLRRHARRAVRDRPRRGAGRGRPATTRGTRRGCPTLVRGFDVVVAQRLPVPTMRALAGSSDARDLRPLRAADARAARAGRTRDAPSPERRRAGAAEQPHAGGRARDRRRVRLRERAAAGLLARRADERGPARPRRVRARTRRCATLIDVVPFGIDAGAARAGAGAARRRPGHRRGRQGPALAGRDLELVRPADGHPRRRTSCRADARRRPALLPRACAIRTPSVPGRWRWPSRGGRARGRARAARPRRLLQLRLGAVRRARPYLLDADLAVSAHFDDVETRFAFRTRLLDCLWAGLPVVTTRGDTLGDADRRRRRRAVRSSTATSTAGSDALDAPARRRRGRASARERAARLRRFEWPRVRRAAPPARRSGDRRVAEAAPRWRRGRVPAAPAAHRLRAARPARRGPAAARRAALGQRLGAGERRVR